jgi:hypothetical protein
MPGTVIDIMVMIVRKDMSFKRPQRYCINIDSPKFKIKPPVIAVVDIKLVPSLNLDAKAAAPDVTYGGMVA